MTVTPIRRKDIKDTFSDPPVFAIELPLPSDVDAENELLGALLFDPEAYSTIAPLNLTPEMFYFSPNREIFSAIQTLINTQKSVDLMSVTIYLSDRGLLESAGGKSRLRELAESIVSAVRIDTCAESVRDKYFRRLGHKRAIEASQLFLDTSKPLESVLDASESMVFSVKNESDLGIASEPEAVGNLIDAYLERLESPDPVSLKTGFLDLDEKSGGLRKGDLIIGAGRASMGKTQLGVSWAYNVARLHNLPVLFLSLEMPKEEVLSRLLSLHCQVNSFNLLYKRMTKEDYEKLASGLSTFPDLPIEIDDNVDLTIATIRSKVRRLTQKYQVNPALIVLDYVQLMGDSPDNRVRELDIIVKGLKAIAKEYKTSVLGLAQISRAVETRADKRPTMADIRECGAIEQHSDKVITLYRNDYYNPDSKDGRIELNLIKNRGGQTGKVSMLFNPEYSQFRDEASRY